MALFLFHGENSYLLQQAVQELIAEFTRAEGDLNLSMLDGRHATAGEIVANAEAMPFLGTRRLVLVRDFDAKRATPELTTFFAHLPETTTLVFTMREVDARTSFFKQIKKLGTLREFAPLKPAEFRRWLANEVKTKNLSVEPAALELLANFTLGDEFAAANELNKLATYVNEKKILRADVERLVHADLHTSIFCLTDALGTREINLALSTLSDLVNRGENLVQIFFMIVRQFRILLSIKALLAKKTPAFQMASELKLNPYVVTKSLPQTRNFSVPELIATHRRLLAIDTEIKTGKISYTQNQPHELALALEKFIVGFAKSAPLTKAV